MFDSSSEFKKSNENLKKQQSMFKTDDVRSY